MEKRPRCCRGRSATKERSENLFVTFEIVLAHDGSPPAPWGGVPVVSFEMAGTVPAWYSDADGTTNILSGRGCAPGYWHCKSIVCPNSGNPPWAHQAKRHGFCLDRLDAPVRGAVQGSRAHWF